MVKIVENKKNEAESENNSPQMAEKDAGSAGPFKLLGETGKDIEKMFVAGVHFGYSRSTRHPKMDQYTFGVRNNIEIFDLEKTQTLLKKAEEFLKELAKDGKKILIVSTKPAFRQITETGAKESGMPYVCERWLGGTLTNFKVIKERINYFTGMRQKKESGELNKYTKKEISVISKELLRMERFFKGLESLTALPNALLVIDPKEEKTAMREAKALSIPIIAVLNSDCDPSGINYPIPANDVSVSSVKYLLEKLIKAYQNGKQQSADLTDKK